MSSPRLLPVRAALPFGLALAALGLLAYAAVVKIRLPHEGLNWSPITGEVLEIDPAGPAVGKLTVGEYVLAVNGVPAAEAARLYPGFRPGEVLTMTVRGVGGERGVAIQLQTPPALRLMQRLAPLMVALAFLIIGSVVLGFGGANPQARLFFIFSLAGGSVLASGSLSNSGPVWTSALFNILLRLAGPLSVHLHLHFPEARQIARWRLPLAVLYATGLVLSLPFIYPGAQAIQVSEFNALVFAAGRLFLTLNLLLVVVLLARAYRQARSVQVRQKIRLVALGGSLALMLVIALIIGPEVLILHAFVPYEVGLFFLIILPLAYGYAILRHRLIQLDDFVNRGAAYTLVFVALVGIYLVLATLFNRLLPSGWQQLPVVNMLQVLILAGSSIPIYRRIRSLVDWVFYGGWYDFRSAVERITAGLSGLKDPAELAERLTTRLCSTFRMDRARLFVVTQGELLTLQSSSTNGPPPEPPLAVPLQGAVVQVLSRQLEPLTHDQLQAGVRAAPLAQEEHAALAALRQCLLVPIHGSNALIGLLALGARKGGERFSDVDLAILRIVARHTAAAIENIHLLQEVRLHAAEVEKLHRQLLHAREDERKFLARELHDEAIQALVGLNYRLAQTGDSVAGEIQAEVRRIVEDLRGMIRTLRPPALDNFGLVTAIRSHVRELGGAGQDGSRIDLRIEGEAERWLPEDIQICLYRVLQEALLNVEKHAAARHVQVVLDIQPRQVRLEVQDDGSGFRVPQHLGSLLERDHFGLVGLRERLELVHGTLHIASAAGEGTQLTAVVPLPEDG